MVRYGKIYFIISIQISPMLKPLRTDDRTNGQGLLWRCEDAKLHFDELSTDSLRKNKYPYISVFDESVTDQRTNGPTTHIEMRGCI